MWILITYTEKAPDGTYPNYIRNLHEKLSISLEMVQKIFDYDHFEICVRNVGKSIRQCDFRVCRRSNPLGIAEIVWKRPSKR